jgi:5-methylcytosine-specific restriction protein B
LKYRDFVTGLVPVAGAASQTFEITEGTMYRASEYAKGGLGTSLLIIDEINRGPAVQIFGGSIVAIEADKRLLADGSVGPETTLFELLSPATKRLAEYALPHHLFILAAMNQADTSVEPLDVAFLRRWAPFVLQPDSRVLVQWFGLSALNDPVPTAPAEPKHVFAAAAQAWQAVNERIVIGRGSEFQIGHGVLMTFDPQAQQSLASALRVVGEAWRVVRAHVDEVFFGDTRGIAAVLNISDQVGTHLYRLENRVFADEPRLEIVGPTFVRDIDLYKFLKAVRGA